MLKTLLRGPTRSFTALVGYFGHRVDETAIERYGSVTDPTGFGQVDGEDPAGFIVREAVEENLREGQNFDQTAFRLLAGRLLLDGLRRLTGLVLALSLLLRDCRRLSGDRPL